jgi:hypothetical protein
MTAGRYVPFLGAGSSQCDAIPSGEKLAQVLASKANLDQGIGRPHTCTCRCCCNHCSVPLDAAASYLAATVNRETLERTIRNEFSDTEPLPIHKYLADLDCPLMIITTNYDRLLESAFLTRKERGLKSRPFDVLSLKPDQRQNARELVLVQYNKNGKGSLTRELDADLLAGRIDPENRTLIYKMHGTLRGVARLPDHFLITEEDYENALLDIDRFLPPAILAHLDGRQLLFLGYGLRDWNVRAILRRLIGFVGPCSKAVVFEPTELVRRLWGTRRLEIIDMRIDDFVEELKRG